MQRLAVESSGGRLMVMKMSRLYAPTLKEDPAEAELASHKLMLRAGMIRKQAAGLYSYLPLAWRSLRKIESIVRDEMDAADAQEMLLPILTDAELWRGERALERLRTRAHARDRPPRARVRPRPHARGDHHRPHHQRTQELQAAPREPLPDPGQVPRRDAPPLRAHARTRVHHEGRLLLQRHAGEPAGDLRRHEASICQHLRARGAQGPSRRGRFRPDRRRHLRRVHGACRRRRGGARLLRLLRLCGRRGGRNDHGARF